MGSALVHRLARIAVIMCLVLAVPGAALASGSSPEAGASGNYRGQCKRLTRQINHFENEIMPLAAARGNQAWAQATRDQVERLWNRRADLCPAYGAERTMMRRAADQARKVNQFLAAAARAAAAYFSGGIVGP